MDTSALMNPGFQIFIENNKELILYRGVIFIICNSVYKELAKHLGGNDRVKCRRSMAAIDFIVKNRSIFEIESSLLTDEDIENAFADL